MKSTSLKTALICISSVLAVAAFAQQDQPSSTTPSTGTGTEMGKSTAQGNSWRASKSIGADVKDAQGQKLGKVSDLIINSSNGHVDFAVLDYNNKLIPVPFSLLTPSMTTGRTGLFAPTGAEYSFTANVDATKLQNAPGIDKSRWEQIRQTDWSQKINQYYGVQPGGMGAPGMGTEKGTGMGTEQPGTGTEKTPGTGTEKTPDTTPSPQ